MAEIDRLLTLAGHCPVDKSREAVAVRGRNTNWLFRTEDGISVFAKQINRMHSDREERIGRLALFEEIRASSDFFSTRSPRLVGHSLELGICVFEGIEDATPGTELTDDRFTDDHIEQTAEILAQLHSFRITEPDELLREPLHLPNVQVLDAVPMYMLDRITAAEIQAWSLIQRDDEVCRGISRLLALEQAVDPVPIHGDFRLDQLLVRDQRVVITDWEEFRVGDPARDVGGYIGQWIQRSLNQALRSNRSSAAIDLRHEAILTIFVNELSAEVPRIQLFWDAYRRASPGPVGESFATRVTAFAGWHLFDRLLASASHTMRLSGIDRAIAGVGRMSLSRPERYSEALGLVA